MAVGIPLGIIVGALGGAAFVILLRAALTGDALKVVASLVGMPASIFGGGWLTTVFDLATILSSYVVSVAATFSLIAVYPLARFVIRLGNELGAA